MIKYKNKFIRTNVSTDHKMLGSFFQLLHKINILTSNIMRLPTYYKLPLLFSHIPKEPNLQHFRLFGIKKTQLIAFELRTKYYGM